MGFTLWNESMKKIIIRSPNYIVMNKKFILKCLALASISFFVSCHRDNPANPDDDNNTSATTHVYVAGNTGYTFNAGPAVCWEDGIQHVLDPDAFETARAACVIGNDVYYGGCNANEQPVIWKNGVAQKMSEGNGRVSGLTTAGGKLYACGTVDQKPVYWVDGQIHYLDEDPSASSDYTTTAITVSGGNIYVSGYLGNEYNSAKGAYLWKNGSLQKLSTKASKACDVCVYNNTVYVVGSESYTSGGIQKSVMWVNGAIRDIQVTTNNGLGSEASAVAIKDGKPYIVLKGFVGGAYDGYWKGFAWYNETVTVLPNCSNPTDVFIHNNDIYIAGYNDSFTSYEGPVLLKNLEFVPLTNSANDGHCYSVYVK